MYKVKIFKSGEGFDALEEAINTWFANYKGEDFKFIDIKYSDNNRYASALVIYMIRST